MSKDPAILFYTSDFLTGTLTMSDEQVGKYTRLLCYQHQKGRLTEKDMLSICKSYDEDVFSKFKKDRKGMYYNERLETEIIKRRNYSESRAKNRKGHKNKDLKDNISNSYEAHMENENENENINVIKDNNRNGKKINFAEFLAIYPKKRCLHNEMESAWDRFTYEEQKAIMDFIPEYVKDTKPNYIQKIENFFLDRRWENPLNQGNKYMHEGKLYPVEIKGSKYLINVEGKTIDITEDKENITYA